MLVSRLLQDVLDELVDCALKAPNLSPIVPALKQLHAQATVLDGERPVLARLARQEVSLTAVQARNVIEIVSKIPPLEELFGEEPTEAVRIAYATFLTNLHSCIISSVFNQYPELVRSTLSSRLP